jgi:hypothetical protein
LFKRLVAHHLSLATLTASVEYTHILPRAAIYQNLGTQNDDTKPIEHSVFASQLPYHSKKHKTFHNRTQTPYLPLPNPYFTHFIPNRKPRSPRCLVAAIIHRPGGRDPFLYVSEYFQVPTSTPAKTSTSYNNIQTSLESSQLSSKSLTDQDYRFGEQRVNSGYVFIFTYRDMFLLVSDSRAEFGISYVSWYFSLSFLQFYFIIHAAYNR